MMRGLFLDLIDVPVGVTNDTLEYLYKAISDHGDGDDALWRPHESVFLAKLIELFTKRGLDRIQAVRDALAKWTSGAGYKGDAEPSRPGELYRWDEVERALVTVYLQNLPVSEWTVDDHMLAVDLVMQTYLPRDQIVPEAKWLASRSVIMGRVEAVMPGASQAQTEKILQAAEPQRFNWSEAGARALAWAETRAAENVVAMADSSRHALRRVVADAVHQRQLGLSVDIETRLRDAFGDMNRDWRRIALTEGVNAQLEGFVATAGVGARLKRVEQYKGACQFCRKIDGVVVTVVDPAKPDKDADKEIWAGKNNVGRSVAPMKRVGGKLIPREAHEMAWIPVGAAHPACRGRWVSQVALSKDPEFAKTLDGILRKKN